MSDLILHHYEISPFSEKVRRILAWKALSWLAVRAPAVMPKPDLVALTGGYRKIPVLQIENHVYCDSARIARVLEERSVEPTLYPSPIAEVVAEWADGPLFEAATTLFMRPTRFDDLVRLLTQDELASMMEDRKIMRKDALRNAAAPRSVRAQLDVYLARLDAALVAQPFLLGPAPSIADFSTHHSLWLIERVAPEALAAFAHVRAWMRRIAAFPDAHSEPLSSEDALRISREGDPSWTPPEPFADTMGLALEQAVIVRANDYGRDPVRGALVSSTANELVLRREDERAGTVYVHFPRLGFEIVPDKGESIRA
jgi:glutathione S-transferase